MEYKKMEKILLPVGEIIKKEGLSERIINRSYILEVNLLK
jgi:hypothetical protein